MILFWGRSNERAMEYGRSNLGHAYLFVRWESLCQDPESNIRRILEFCDLGTGRLDSTCALVRLPRSIGRWKRTDPSLRNRVLATGLPYLERFGYQDLEITDGELV